MSATTVPVHSRPIIGQASRFIDALLCALYCVHPEEIMRVHVLLIHTCSFEIVLPKSCVYCISLLTTLDVVVCYACPCVAVAVSLAVKAPQINPSNQIYSNPNCAFFGRAQARLMVMMLALFVSAREV